MSSSTEWVEVGPEEPLVLDTPYQVAYAGGKKPGTWRTLIPRSFKGDSVLVSYPEDAPGVHLKEYKRSRMTRVKAERSVFHTGAAQEPEVPLFMALLWFVSFVLCTLVEANKVRYVGCMLARRLPRNQVQSRVLCDGCCRC